MGPGNHIPQDKWKTIVENVLIVSVDLIIFYNGGIVLGKRENKPAKGKWFVPGGQVLKNENLEDAIHRIAEEELGTEVEVRDFLGTYEHIYESSESGCAFVFFVLFSLYFYCISVNLNSCFE